jgi:hypothetical protein
MGDTREELERELRREFPAQSPAYSDFGLEGIRAQTIKATETPQLGVSLPLDLQGTPLQISVWQALQAIPIGETATYEEIAPRIGTSNAGDSVCKRVWIIRSLSLFPAIALWETMANLASIDGDGNASARCSIAKLIAERRMRRKRCSHHK